MGTLQEMQAYLEAFIQGHYAEKQPPAAVQMIFENIKTDLSLLGRLLDQQEAQTKNNSPDPIHH